LSESKTQFIPEYRTISVKTVDGTILRGKVNISGSQRVSELFTAGHQPFLVLTETESRDGAGKTLFINKNHVVWIEPED
jgi:hypothetical protein